MKTGTNPKEQLLKEVKLLYINERGFLFRLHRMKNNSWNLDIGSYLEQMIETHKLQCYRLEGILIALRQEPPSFSRTINSPGTLQGAQLVDYQTAIGIAEFAGCAEIGRLLKRASIKKRGLKTFPVELMGQVLRAA